jgi:membrane protein required for colicin V production
MNIIDMLILAVSLAGATLGAVKGVSRILLAALGLVCGIVIAARLHLPAGNLLERLVNDPSLRNTVGFVLVFVLTWIIFLLLGCLVSWLLKKTGLCWLDRTVGGGMGLGAALLFLFFLLILLTALLPVNSPLLTESRLSPVLLGTVNRASLLVRHQTQDRFSDKLEAVRTIWEQTSAE